ncbi:MAG: ATP-binding cassette domain-containing protein [Absicoccus sp.]|uniref:ATP-binding cassette domain-containing protein n=1 Tax=Absicoccus sp. TaxID=2718527 RepID=UPI002A762F8A|nr:ATP-binding cassette domain-containing protein [Absicoccus sp.]MDY3036358.1 ATP-binding cassette domain-containing protein [Absicoccus sp.]
MLQIQNCTLLHTKDGHQLMDSFSMTANPGDKIVLIGEEGNGKSTFLKWIYDPQNIQSYIEYHGQCIHTNERLAYLPQQLPPHDQNLTIYAYFCESDAFWDLQTKMGKYAKTLGLPADLPFRDQSMATLSGGEKVKVQLLRLLLEEPTCILLDEPSNDLDIDTLEWLESWIRSYPGILLFISHDETLIENTANRILHFEQLKKKTQPKITLFKGNYATYLQMRQRAFDRQKQQAQEQRKEKKQRDARFQRIQQKVEYAQNTISRQDAHGGQLLKKKMHAVKSLEHRFEKADANMLEIPEQEEAIRWMWMDPTPIPTNKQIIHLHLDRLETNRILANDLDLSIVGPEKVCIIGKNGAGKSTLLKRIYAQLTIRDDLVVAYMPQNYADQMAFEQTPVAFLRTYNSNLTMIRNGLAALKFTREEMEHALNDLSQGQLAKCFLLAMGLKQANVLILDEPTRNLSPLSNPLIRSMFQQFPGTIISVSHDRKYISEVCDTVYVLDEHGLTKK